MTTKTDGLADASVTAGDGAVLGYRSIGAGPGVVVVHGAMQSAISQSELAGLLADRFRVHLIDRRGRGRSSAYPARPSPSLEVDDVRAVLAATGSRRVFGISSGALIAARTALAEPSLERLVLFEPPLAIDGSVRLDLLDRFDTAMAAGRLPRAMALAMKAAEMGPPWMFRLPTPVLALAGRRSLRTGNIRALVEALPADFRLVRANAERLAEFAAVAAPTLLLDGTATRPYLRRAVTGLAHTIPGARHVELAGQTHSAPQNRDQYGHPDTVAPALRTFLA